jgi:hypothetical protein
LLQICSILWSLCMSVHPSTLLSVCLSIHSSFNLSMHFQHGSWDLLELCLCYAHHVDNPTLYYGYRIRPLLHHTWINDGSDSDPSVSNPKVPVLPITHVKTSLERRWPSNFLSKVTHFF